MAEGGRYFTKELYAAEGFAPFLNQTVQYLAGAPEAPLAKTSAEHNHRGIFFTFSDPLFEEFLRDPESMKKPYEAAIKYGFRGHSKGGKNGIFYLRKSDSGLVGAMRGLRDRYSEEISDTLDVSEKDFGSLNDVKVVWHNPSGERIVGAYNHKNHKILFLDFARY